MKSPWSTIPAVPATLILCTGIAVSYMCTAVTATAVWIIVGASALLTALSAIYIRHAMATMTAAALGLGVWLGYSSRPVYPPAEVMNTYGTATCIVRAAKPTDLSTRSVVDVVSWTPRKDTTRTIATDFTALCTTIGHNGDIRPGATIRLETRIQPVEQDIDLPFQTDYSRFLYIDGVTARMFAYTEDVEVVDPDQGPWDCTKTQMRDHWLGAIVQAGFDEETTKFMLAVLGGDTLFLDEETEEDFRRAGLSHILAISGMHVGIVTTVLLILLYPLKIPRRTRRLYFVAVAAAVWLFAIASGLSLSVCRAALMCTVVMIARCIETNTNPYQSLAIALFIIAVFEPLAIFSPGLQFSVCAVLAIITFVPRLDIVPRKYRILRAAWLVVIIPPVAVLGTAALTIFYYHSFTVDFWLANIAAAVLVPLIVGCGFVATLLTLIGLPSYPLSWICDTLYDAILQMTGSTSDIIADQPLSVFLNNGQITAMVAAIILTGWLIRNFSYRKFAVVGLAVVALTVFAFADNDRDNLPSTEVYIPRHRLSTDIIIVDNHRAYLLTTAKHPRKRPPEELIRNQYTDFMQYRRVTGPIERISDGFETGNISYKDNILTASGLRIGLIESDRSLRGAGHVDVAVVCEHYKGEIDSLVRAIDADSIFLARSIHHKRAAKWCRMLSDVPVAWRRLDERGFVWSSQ